MEAIGRIKHQWNVVVEWLAFLLHIQEVLGLGSKTGYPDKCVLCFSPVTPGKF
jgi:hypothetical protein